MKVTVVFKGGPGSGNYGHRGRPGLVGGSQPGYGISKRPLPKDFSNNPELEQLTKDHYYSIGVAQESTGEYSWSRDYVYYDAREHPAMLRRVVGRLKGEIESHEGSKDYPNISFWARDEHGRETDKHDISVDQAKIILSEMEVQLAAHDAQLEADLKLPTYLEYLDAIGVDIDHDNYYAHQKMDKDHLNNVLAAQDHMAKTIAAQVDPEIYSLGEVKEKLYNHFVEEASNDPRLTEEQRDNARSWLFNADTLVKDEMEFEARHKIAKGEWDPAYAGDVLEYRSNTQGRSGWQPLPADLWHVTTNAEGVRNIGLKSRRELGMWNGPGLSGGENDTISLTEDYNIAKSIERSIHEAHMVAKGDLMPSEMIELARRGSGTPDGHSWIKDLVGMAAGSSSSDYSGETDDDLPYNMKNLLKWEAGGWKDDKNYDGTPMTWEDFMEKVWDFYHLKFLPARGLAGGFEDPCFFGTDWKALAKLNPANFSILHLKSKPGSRGYQMSGLGEWRTVGGDTMDLIDVINEYVPEDRFTILGE